MNSFSELLRYIAQAEIMILEKLLESATATTLAVAVTAWFMFKAEKRFDAMTKEIRGLNHRFYGMQKTLLLDVAARVGSDSTAKKIAHEMLSEMEAREKSGTDVLSSGNQA